MSSGEGLGFMQIEQELGAAPISGSSRRAATGALLFLLSAVGFGGLAYLGVALTRDESRIAAVWAPNAVLIALIIRQDVRNWPAILCAAFIGNITSNLLGGDELIRATGLSLANSIEIICLLLLLNHLKCRRPDFSKNGDIGMFAMAASASASISGLVACLVLNASNLAEALDTWWTWARADALGLLLFTPALTILLDAWETRQAITPKKFAESLLVVGCGSTVCILTFWQTSYPFLFLDAPVVLVYAWRLGTLGIAIAIINLAIIATVATSLGHGPINLVQGGTSEKLMVMQVFLASSFAVGLPFSALTQSLRQNEARYRQAATELADANRTFDTLARISPVGIFRCDIGGACTYANQTSLEFSGVSFEQATGGHFSQHIHEHDRGRVLGRWKRQVVRGRGFSDEVRISVPGEEDRWLQTLITPEKDEAGEVTGFMGIQVDITDRREGERELREARDRAEDASRAKTNFLANMSHEIRTPMNGVLGFADLLLASDLDERQRHHAALIAESGQSMVALIDDILDLSKVDADAMRISADRIDLRETLDGAIQLMRGAAIKKGLELSFQLSDDLPRYVTGDALRIRQIITNLLGNAVKFSETGVIKVSAELRALDSGRSIQICISDEGAGIAAERLETIFEQFAQENDAVASTFGGSGLGLAIARRLARLMGGDITVASIVDEGSTFTVELPFRAAHEATGQSVHSLPSLPSAQSEPERHDKILIVEDHPINQELISSLVGSFGIPFDLAANGAEAVDMVSMKGPDASYSLVLMDIQMPRLDGLSATKEIRDAGYTPEELPIIALTANAFPEDIEACRYAGMQDHLAKPVSSDKLKMMIEKWSISTAEQQGKREEEFFRSIVSRHRQKFEVLTSDTVALARDWLETDESCREAETDHFADKLHQLAGIGGLFARDDLGQAARAVERMLTTDLSTTATVHLEVALKDLIRLARDCD